MVCSNVHKSPLWKCERVFLATVYSQTNRGSGLKRCLFKSIVHSWRRPGFFFFFTLIALWKEVLALQNYYQELNMEGSRTVGAILGAESVTEAWTTQLCFHSFIQGGGRRGRGGMRKQHWINLTALIQMLSSYKWSPLFHLKHLMGSCGDVLVGQKLSSKEVFLNQVSQSVLSWTHMM